MLVFSAFGALLLTVELGQIHAAIRRRMRVENPRVKKGAAMAIFRPEAIGPNVKPGFRGYVGGGWQDFTIWALENRFEAGVDADVTN